MNPYLSNQQLVVLRKQNSEITAADKTRHYMQCRNRSKFDESSTTHSVQNGKPHLVQFYKVKIGSGDLYLQFEVFQHYRPDRAQDTMRTNKFV